MGFFQSSFLGIWNWTALASNCLFAMMIFFLLPRQSDDKDLRTSEFHRSFRFLSPPLLAGASPVPPRVTRPLHRAFGLSKQPVIQKNEIASTIEISSSMLSSSSISDWCVFFPSWMSCFWLLHVQKNARLTHHLPPSGSVQLVPGLSCCRLRQIAMLMIA